MALYKVCIIIIVIIIIVIIMFQLTRATRNNLHIAFNVREYLILIFVYTESDQCCISKPPVENDIVIYSTPCQFPVY